jgi:rod shape-determining protein MreB
MVVDIGAGTADIGVIALGGLVTSAAVPSGGVDFDESVRRHLVRARGLLVDARTARSLRLTSGALVTGRSGVVEVLGRDARSGRVRHELIERAELRAPLMTVVAPIVHAAVACITAAPPDVANDLVVDGLYLLGGAARLEGLDQAMASATGVPVHVPDELDRLVVTGAARCLRDRLAQGATTSSARR